MSAINGRGGDEEESEIFVGRDHGTKATARITIGSDHVGSHFGIVAAETGSPRGPCAAAAFGSWCRPKSTGSLLRWISASSKPRWVREDMSLMVVECLL